MRLHRLLLVSTLFALPAQAQDETPISMPSLDVALPADVRRLLASTPPGQSLFPVNGSEPFAGAVLKANVISFSADSELVLGATTAPFIIIAARDIKFPDAQSSYRIRFDTVTAANGTDGSDGAGGNGTGAAGIAGAAGGPGSTLTLPRIYLIVDHFSVASDPKPRMINLALKFRGVAGGDGGRGGAGGDGSDGERGRKASDGPVSCNSGGGDGTRGGNGGASGPGGNGSPGGDGGSLTFVSTRLGISQFGYASIQNQGGNGGGNGLPGRSGQPGKGGPGGHGSHYCHGGHGGPGGLRPAAALAGMDGERGAKGKVELRILPSTAFFD